LSTPRDSKAAGRHRASRQLHSISVMPRRPLNVFSDPGRFTARTLVRLEKAVGNALCGRRGGTSTLRTAVQQATRELRAGGLDEGATAIALGALVEEAAPMWGAD